MTVNAAGVGHGIDHVAYFKIIGIRGGHEATLQIGVELLQNAFAGFAHRHIDQGFLYQQVRGFGRSDDWAGGNVVGGGDNLQAVGTVSLRGRQPNGAGVELPASGSSESVSIHRVDRDGAIPSDLQAVTSAKMGHLCPSGCW